MTDSAISTLAKELRYCAKLLSQAQWLLHEQKGHAEEYETCRALTCVAKRNQASRFLSVAERYCPQKIA